MSQVHFAIVETITYSTEGVPVLQKLEELPVAQVAEMVGAAALANGKPQVTEGIEERDGYPWISFLFPKGQTSQQALFVKRVNADRLRELYRAAHPSSDGLEPCGRCNGTGIYRGAGYVENGVFKGYTGTCFRCKGRKRVHPRVNAAGERGRGEYAGREQARDLA